MKEWLDRSTAFEKKALANAVRRRIIYFYQISQGIRNPSPALAKDLENITSQLTPDRVMHRHDLRPDIWDAA